jgi:hypothetical protein
VKGKHPSIAKITRPRITGILPRKRLFHYLDSCRKYPVIWITGPAGSGKTTLVSSYLDANKLPCLWYQVDEGDSDIATFFSYMGMAARKAAPRKRTPHKSKWGRWFKYNLTLKKGRSSMRAYAETSETRCPGDIASCDGTGDRKNQHIQDG